jgi:hypothetical protein
MAFIDTHPDESVFHLLRELKDDLTDLIRKEIALAKSEVSAKIKEVGKSAVFLGIAAVAGIFAVFYLCLFLDHLLFAGLSAVGMPTLIAAWCAPLILGVMLAVGGLVLALSGLKMLRKADPAHPKSWRTVRSLRAIRAQGQREAHEGRR